MFKACDLIPKLKARPKYQLLSETKFAYNLLLYLLWLIFLSYSTTFNYKQL